MKYKEVLEGLVPNAKVRSLLKSGNLRNEASLEEMGHLLKLNQIAHDFQLTIHVAGTKGKGSVCAYLERLFRLVGKKRTGLFTSPHLRSPRERIRLNGASLSEEHLDELICTILPDEKLTYFRAMVLAGWKAFQEQAVDVAIVEAGIGGRYDSTNVLQRPAACIITSLALEHEAMLGDTLSQIAWHKAGIMKSGIPVFTCVQPEEAMQVLKEESEAVGAPLHVVPSEGSPFDINSSLALAAFKLFYQEADTRECIRIMRETCWPGRQHRVGRFFLDGAHTLESIQAALQAFLSSSNAEEASLVFACGADKNYQRLMTPLLEHPWKNVYVFGDQQHHKKMAMHCNGRIITKVDEVEDDSVLVTGSLYLVGAFLEALNIDVDQL